MSDSEKRSIPSPLSCFHVSTRRSMFYCYHATTRTARSRLLSSCNANGKINGHHHGETTPNSIMRRSGISDILEGRSCPEPEYIRPRPSMARIPTRAVTRSQDVIESGTQSGTGETPPTDTISTTQPGEGATPFVDPEYSPTSSSSVVGSVLTTERRPNVCTSAVVR